MSQRNGIATATSGVLQQKPWETGKSIGIPEGLWVSSFLIDESRRWYLDVVPFGKEIAVKIAQKSPARRSYVKFLASEVGEIRKALLQLTQISSPGRTEAKRRKRAVLGSVEMAKHVASGRGWSWLEEKLLEIQNKVQALGVVQENAEKDHEKVQIRRGTSDNMIAQKSCSYKEALPREEGEGEAKRKTPIMSYPSVEPIDECISQNRLAKGIKDAWKLAAKPRLYALGSNLWLVNLTSREEQQHIVTLAEELKQDLLLQLCAWSPHLSIVDPTVWVTIVGVPVHLWREEVFRALASLTGTVVEIDRNTIRGDRLDQARVRVVASPTFNEEISVPINVGATLRCYRIAAKIWKKKEVRSPAGKASPATGRGEVRRTDPIQLDDMTSLQKWQALGAEEVVLPFLAVESTKGAELQNEVEEREGEMGREACALVPLIHAVEKGGALEPGPVFMANPVMGPGPTTEYPELLGLIATEIGQPKAQASNTDDPIEKGSKSSNKVQGLGVAWMHTLSPKSWDLGFKSTRDRQPSFLPEC
ncbi:hypothetical protein H6P81_006684 [Aristolochia fimbriata]|uniref:DUF4283 domain-containing protein n=1 Tax=Aristolochia fimbriata TaxID=158543 RepID=A0AAV7EY11_ARIFI|nr:hypothetical protein H6P81_006684 [Aristolochia fimbriata]